MTTRIPVIYFHSPVIVIPVTDSIAEMPEEIHLDEGEVTEEEFEEILGLEQKWGSTLDATRVTEDDWLQEYDQ